MRRKSHRSRRRKEIHHAADARSQSVSRRHASSCRSDAINRRWEVQPIYLAFVGDGIFAAGQTPLYYARLTPATATHPFSHDEHGLGPLGRSGAGGLHRERYQGSLLPQSVRIEFTWKDATPVAGAEDALPLAAGRLGNTPLDSTSPFGQPCDAVEALLDLRDEKSAARYTSNMDSIPQGTARVGLYRIEENGKLVCRLQVSPPEMTPRSALSRLGDDRFAIQCSGAVPRCGVGLNFFVTDAAEYAPNKTDWRLSDERTEGRHRLDRFLPAD